jgi:hypothetical protein
MLLKIHNSDSIYLTQVVQKNDESFTTAAELSFIQNITAVSRSIEEIIIEIFRTLWRFFPLRSV